MVSVFDPAAEAALRARVARLTATAPARWGRMNVAQMLCHLVDGFRIPLGEVAGKARITPFRLYPLRWLFVYTLPWPKGKLPTTPEFQQTQPGAWESDRQAWEMGLSRFVARGRQAQAQWSPHPAFGPLSTAEWGRLVYRHTDHHLRQFGV